MQNLKKNLIALVILSISFTSCLKDKAPVSGPILQNENEINTLAQRYLELGYFSGSILVAEKDSVIFSESYGLADYNRDRPFTDSTTFRIGALSELFTAAVIEQMAEDKLIDHNEKVAAYLPEIRDNYTVNDLLRHQSGLQDISSIKEAYPGLPYSAIEYANLSNQISHKNTGNSDLGYELLALIIERIHGLPLREAIAKYAADWQMENTSFKDPDPVREAKGYLYHNYRGEGMELQEVIGPNAKETYSSMGYRSTPRDLLNLIHRMPGRDIDRNGYLTDDGFSYSLSRDNRNGLSVIILSNRRHPVAGEMSESIKAILENRTYRIPLPREEVEIDPFLFRDYAGSYALNPDMELQIINDNDSLFMIMGPERIHLKPQSRNQFFIAQSDASIRFVRDSTGTVNTAILLNGFLDGNKVQKVSK